MGAFPHYWPGPQSRPGGRVLYRKCPIGAYGARRVVGGAEGVFVINNATSQLLAIVIVALEIRESKAIEAPARRANTNIW